MEKVLVRTLVLSFFFCSHHCVLKPISMKNDEKGNDLCCRSRWDEFGSDGTIMNRSQSGIFYSYGYSKKFAKLEKFSIYIIEIRPRNLKCHSDP